MRINKLNLLLACIFFLAIALRFYNFEQRINFGPEQAISLITAADYLHKPSLLGLPSVQRTTSFGHTIFFGPQFTYSLVPLLLLFKFDPVWVTGFFGILNIFTGGLLFYLIKKRYNLTLAMFSMILFLFNQTMIYHSLFIWIVNYLPLIGLLVLYLLILFKEKQKVKYVVNIGFLTGLGFSLEYMLLFTGIPFALLPLLYWSKNKVRDFFVFIFSAALANSPTIVFDLKHDFYHLRTLWQYSLDTFQHPGQGGFVYYHFLQMWPALCLIGGVFLSFIFRKNKYLAIFFLLIYLAVNIFNKGISFTDAVGMPKGLHYSQLNIVAQTIAADNPKDFNVATTYDFDTRAHPLRYLLTYRYHFTPMDVTEYPHAKELYVFGTSNYNFESSPWEINSFPASKTSELKQITDQYTLYKLDSSH